MTIYSENGKLNEGEPANFGKIKITKKVYKGSPIRRNNELNMEQRIVDTAIARARSLVGNGLDNPKTFQEKLCWLNCYDLDNIDLKTKCCDKLTLNEYCKEAVGENLCPKILKVYDSVDSINLSELPNKFILKCNHGSGFNIIVNNKSTFNLGSAKVKLKGWLAKNYCTAYWYELFYYGIKPKVYAEELIGSDLFDYKFWCFNGEPKFMVINDGHGHGEFKTFDMNFKPMSLDRTDLKYNSKKDYKKPQNFDKMAEYARKLSKPFKFVRVDFYEANGRIYLGELTFMPGAGNFKYRNPEDNIKVGNMLDLGNKVSMETKQEIIRHNTENAANRSVQPQAFVKTATETTTAKPSETKQRNKKVVYMAITGNADKVVPPKTRTDGFDYICYIDDMSKGAKGWEMRPIPESLKGLSKAKQNRYIKTHPHEFFSEYDFSIYIDGNVDLLGDINDFMKKNGISMDKGSIFLGKHPSRNCLYQERDVVVKMKKDTKENTEPMMKRYKDEGFPKNYGLSQNCIIFRYHNDPGCVKVMNQWWGQIEKYSHRDQLSLFYVFWKNQDVKPVMLSKDIFKCTCFKWIGVHRK